MTDMNENQSNDCRKFARQIWREEPALSAIEIINRKEILDVACGGVKFTEAQLFNAIRPPDAPTDELPRLKKLDIWQLVEAVSVWRDINPFIVTQSRRSGNVEFWNNAFHPNLREKFSVLYEQAESSSNAGTLKVTFNSSGEMLVTPQDFYVWAILAVGEPNGDRPTNFFEELKSTWPNLTQPAPYPDGSTTPDNKISKKDKINRKFVNLVENGDLADFFAIKNLASDELSITFVGDLTETGLSANNMLVISARNLTKRIPLAALDLVNKHTGVINNQGATLLAMTKKKKILKTDANAKKISRLRNLLKLHFGINDDPFNLYRTNYGWEPRFKLHDRRGAADNRAKCEAEKRTISYDDFKNNTIKSDDVADDWLKSVDSSWGDDVDPEL